uniref:Uncharacterized protein n=1 Tax=Arundo donax TaxID=35708 RepID=A0A0A9S3H4_ARUDO
MGIVYSAAQVSHHWVQAVVFYTALYWNLSRLLQGKLGSKDKTGYSSGRNNG